MWERTAVSSVPPDRTASFPFWVCSTAVHVLAVSIAALLIGSAPGARAPAARRPHPQPLLVLLDEAAPLRTGPAVAGRGRADSVPAVPAGGGGPGAAPAEAPAPTQRAAVEDPPPRPSARRDAAPARVAGRARGSDRADGSPGIAAAVSPRAEAVASLPAEPARAGGSTGGLPAGEASAGGEGGATTIALGPADSPMIVSLGSGDPRFSDYLARLAELLEPEWRDAFPRERALYMLQGEVVIEWTVGHGGRVGGLHVVRPSGVPPFDQNVLAGFRRAAARFPRPPADMPLPLLIRAPYRFRNPMFE